MRPLQPRAFDYSEAIRLPNGDTLIETPEPLLDWPPVVAARASTSGLSMTVQGRPLLLRDLPLLFTAGAGAVFLVNAKAEGSGIANAVELQLTERSRR